MAFHASVKRKCFVCHKRVKSVNYNRHMAEKHAMLKKPHECDLCDQSFDNKSSLLRHKRLKHSNSQETDDDANAFYCNDCGQKFMSQSVLARHRATVHMKKFTCPLCSHSYNSKDSLTRHDCYPKGRIFVCSTCGEKFATNELLFEHAQSHSKSDRRSASKKGKQVPSNSDSESDHHKANRSSSSKKRKIQHENSDSELDRYKRARPVKVESNSDTESDHHSLASTTGTDGSDAYDCPRCETSFKTKKDLNWHTCKKSNKRRSKDRRSRSSKRSSKKHDRGRSTQTTDSSTSEEDDKHRCKYCNIEFPTPKKLLFHKCTALVEVKDRNRSTDDDSSIDETLNERKQIALQDRLRALTKNGKKGPNDHSTPASSSKRAASSSKQHRGNNKENIDPNKHVCVSCGEIFSSSIVLRRHKCYAVTR